jgi:DNA-directed RNA polymerase subunit H (RpoH/RPB5)
VEIKNLENKTIFLPEVIDEEQNPWIMKATELSKNQLPKFINLEERVMIISPTVDNIGMYVIEIKLVD